MRLCAGGGFGRRSGHSDPPERHPLEVAWGVFSNEAGLDPPPSPPPAPDTEDPVRQGLISMTGVSFDTTGDPHRY
ncbi:MAG: alanine:cation symporter family protein [Dysosmobacter sp.]